MRYTWAEAPSLASRILRFRVIWLFNCQMINGDTDAMDPNLWRGLYRRPVAPWGQRLGGAAQCVHRGCRPHLHQQNFTLVNSKIQSTSNFGKDTSM